jgi:hypothetical protein
VPFLLLVLIVSAVGVAAVTLRHRSPTTMQSSIDEFERGLAAIAPEDEPAPTGSRHPGV